MIAQLRRRARRRLASLDDAIGRAALLVLVALLAAALALTLGRLRADHIAGVHRDRVLGAVLVKLDQIDALRDSSDPAAAARIAQLQADVRALLARPTGNSGNTTGVSTPIDTPGTTGSTRQRVVTVPGPPGPPGEPGPPGKPATAPSVTPSSAPSTPTSKPCTVPLLGLCPLGEKDR